MESDRTSGVIRQQRATAGQKRPRLYDNIAAQALGVSAPSSVRHDKPSLRPTIEPLLPLPALTPDEAALVHTVGWARSPGYQYWPCIIVDPSVAIGFPKVHARFVSSQLPRRALVQYFGMKAPQFEVVSIPLSMLVASPQHVDIDSNSSHSSVAGPTFFLWGCVKQSQFEAGFSKLPSGRALRSAFKKALVDAAEFHSSAPRGDPLAVAALCHKAGIITILSGSVVPHPPHPAPVPGPRAAFIPGLLEASSDTEDEEAPGKQVPLRPPPAADDEVWGLDTDLTEDERQ